MNFFDKIKQGLKKTSENISANINKAISNFRKVDQDLLDNIEESLITSDVSYQTASEIVQKLEQRAKLENIQDEKQLKEVLKEIIKEVIQTPEDDFLPDSELTYENGPNVKLVIGVNGVGKTTSIGKMACKLKKEGKNILLIPADTFRAAALEQITLWAKQAGVDVMDFKQGEDPSSVVYRGLDLVKSKKYDIIIIDTAGRLHNKKNLMDELGKVNKTIYKVLPDAKVQTLLVLDATTGQNATIQATEFNNIVPIDGFILTKLDGSAKGGAVLSIIQSTKKNVKYVGLGEKQDDFEEFNKDAFVDELIR